MNYSLNYESPGLVSHPTLGIGRVVSAEAEFEDMEEEIIGVDERVLVPDTKLVPYRWVCSLEMYFDDPDNREQALMYPATGTLISDTHVLTCGHAIVEDIKGTKGTIKRLKAKRITVIPGRNGLGRTEAEQMPFGSSEGSSYDAADGWKKMRDYSVRFRSDQAQEAAGQGSTRLLGQRRAGQARSGAARPNPGAGCPHLRLSIRQMRASTSDRECPPPAVNPCGNRGSAQWRTSGAVTQIAGTNQIKYALDTMEGQSGSAVWLRDSATGVLRLIAVHSGPNDAASNRGLLITDEVLRQVRKLM